MADAPLRGRGSVLISRKGPKPDLAVSPETAKTLARRLNVGPGGPVEVVQISLRKEYGGTVPPARRMKLCIGLKVKRI